jgi:transposase InsO family protein
MIHIIPVSGKATASQLASMFLKEVVRLHGLPESIVSDRDPKFTSKWWKEVHCLLGTKLLMSTSFHPQMDGATEQANRLVASELHGYTSKTHGYWTIPSIGGSIL